MAKRAQIDAHSPRRADVVDEAIGRQLRALRSERGLSQAALARAMGVSFQQLQKYEGGRNRLACSTMLKAADALGVSPMDLLPLRQHPSKGAVRSRNNSNRAASDSVAQLAQILADFDRLKSREVRSALVKLVDRLARESR